MHKIRLKHFVLYSLFSAVFSAVTVVLAAPAFATTSAMGAVLCLVICIIMGQFGRGLATLGIIFLGIAATIGKISWGLALVVVVGISVMFSAPAIMAILGFPLVCPACP